MVSTPSAAARAIGRNIVLVMVSSSTWNIQTCYRLRGTHRGRARPRKFFCSAEDTTSTAKKKRNAQLSVMAALPDSPCGTLDWSEGGRLLTLPLLHRFQSARWATDCADVPPGGINNLSIGSADEVKFEQRSNEKVDARKEPGN